MDISLMARVFGAEVFICKETRIEKGECVSSINGLEYPEHDMGTIKGGLAWTVLFMLVEPRFIISTYRIDIAEFWKKLEKSHIIILTYFEI